MREAAVYPVRTVQIRVIGRMEVLVGGRPADPGPPKQRLLLAALLARVNRVVSVDQLIDALWGADAPRTARKNIQVYVSGLRKLLGGRITGLDEKPAIFAAPARAIDGTRKVEAL